MTSLAGEVLGGGHVIDVEAAGADIAGRLSALPGVVRVQPLGPNLYRVDCRHDMRAEIARALAPSAELTGIQLCRAQPQRGLQPLFRGGARCRGLDGAGGSPWTGLGAVVAKEAADHLSSARMRILEALVFLSALTAAYVAIRTIRATIGESPFLFLRLLTLSQDPLPSFIACSGFLIPLVAIALSFDAINGEFNRRTMSRILAQPIYRDALLLGKFLAGLLALGVGAGLAVALGARPRLGAFRGAAEQRGDGANARLPRRDDRLWRRVAGAGAAVFGAVPGPGDGGLGRARRLAAVRAVLDDDHPARRQRDLRPARRPVRAAHRVSRHRADHRPAVAEHALRRDRARASAPGHARPRPGADQPAARRADRRAVAGDAELPLDLAAADRARGRRRS